jgi:hypothetical protein
MLFLIVSFIVATYSPVFVKFVNGTAMNYCCWDDWVPSPLLGFKEFPPLAAFSWPPLLL